MSYIDISDIARAMVIFGEKVMQGETVPANLRIVGMHGSPREIASVMNQAGAGARDVEMKSVDRAKFRTRALGGNCERRDAPKCLRFVMGDGRDDYGDEKEDKFAERQ
jgi:hypothetical protein